MLSESVKIKRELNVNSPQGPSLSKMRIPMNKRMSSSNYYTQIGMRLILSMGFIAFQASESTATISPFTGATATPSGSTIDNTTILTSYTTASGTVTSLSHAVSAQGNFNGAGGGSGVDNVWGAGGTEVDGVIAALNLDLSVGVINAGDTNATTVIDVGNTNDSPFSQFFFSQEVTGGVAGDGNDFFLIELNGNDTIEIVPLDASGNQIGAFSLAVASGGANWGGLGIGVNRIIESLPGNTGVSPLAGMAFDFEDFDDGLGGTLAGLHGIGISGTAGLDTMVVGVNGSLAPVASTDPLFHVNRITGEISLENPDASNLAIRGYSITSSVGALDVDNWLPIAGNKDANGDGTIDANDAWTQLTTSGSTDLSEFEFGGDGGVLGAGQTLVLSQGDGAWVPWFSEGDLQAEIMLADGNGTIVFVPITYEGNNDTALLRSDFNHDGSITAADWTILQTNSFTDLSSLSAIEAYAKGDVDFDGDNDIFDYGKFVADFESANGAGSFEVMINSVPEPSSLFLLSVALGLVFVQQRKRFSVVGSKKTQAIFSLAILGFSLFGTIAVPCFAISPYATDPNTIHLYHFDEAVGTTVGANLGSAGNTIIAFDGSPLESPAMVDTGILGSAGFTGFGNSADIYETDKGLGFDGNGDTNLQRDPTSQDDFIGNASFLGANGAFTVEAMINLADGLVISSEREIMSMDSTAVPRSFYFRISNVGGVGAIRFRSITDGAAVDAPVPTTGAHAFESNTWFHVAFSYDGEGSGDFYWTRMDTGATSANSVGTVAYSDITSSTTGPLVLGNEGRGASTTGLRGLLDEVRISDIARSPNAFVFSDQNAQFTAEVNEITGEIRLVNNTDSIISFSSYQLVSDTAAAFNVGNWNSLSNQSGINSLVNPVDGEDPGSIAGDSAGEFWAEAGGADSNVLSEQFLLGSTSLAAGQFISLDTAYDLSAAESFSFKYFDTTANRVYTGLVNFITSTDNADFNGDGDVDGSDFLAWQRGFESGTTPAEGDADGSGDVNAVDLGIWQTQFGIGNGNGGGSLTGVAVPEPSAMALFLVAALVTAFIRKQVG